MSSVPGFEAAGDQFIDDMREAGLTIVPTARAFDTGVISKPPLQELALSQDQTLLQSETHTQQPSCL